MRVVGLPRLSSLPIECPGQTPAQVAAGTPGDTRGPVPLIPGRVYRFSVTNGDVVLHNGAGSPALRDIRVVRGDAMVCVADVASIYVAASSTDDSVLHVQEEPPDDQPRR